MKTRTAILVLAALALVAGAAWRYYSGRAASPSGDGSQPIASINLACDAGKSIGAAFYESSVTLNLSDGRSLVLPQTEAASGIRYANPDESFVFWGKGNTAFVEEGDAGETYRGCIIVAPDPTGVLTQAFASSTAGFSIRFPEGYSVDPAYRYQALGPGRSIAGVRFIVSADMAAGTNLSRDSYVSVEWLPGAASCSADLFIEPSGAPSTFTDAGIDYSVATGTDAGAGNIYDEAVFAIPGTNPCTAVRYFIHSTQIGNYPEGTVTEFDKAKVVTEFDFIRRSLVLGR